jgi:hypothetical protein
MVRNPVEESIERDRDTRRTERRIGPIARIARNYNPSSDSSSITRERPHPTYISCSTRSHTYAGQSKVAPNC